MYYNLKRFLTIAAATIILSSLTPLPYSSLIRDAEASTIIDITTDTTWAGTGIGQGTTVNVLSGATLTMLSATNGGGTINVNSGGKILVTGLLINAQGAILNVNSGGVFEVQGPSALFQNLDSTLNVNSNGLLTVLTGGELRSNGAFNINPGGGVSVLGNVFLSGCESGGCAGKLNVTADSALAVQGGGELIVGNLGGIDIHGIVAVSSGGILALNTISALTVKSGGILVNFEPSVVLVNPGGELLVNPNGRILVGDFFTVRGVLVVFDNANLTIGGQGFPGGPLTVTQGGVVQMHGTAIVFDGSLLNIDLGSTVRVSPFGTLVIQSGGTANVSLSTLNVEGIFGFSGGLLTVLPNGKVNINFGSSLTINQFARFQHTGTSDVFGELRIKTGGTLNNPDTGIINIQCGGMFVREAGSIFTGNPVVNACP